MSLQSRTQSRAEADGPARSVRIQLVSESNGSPLAGVADPFPNHCRRSIMALTAQRCRLRMANRRQIHGPDTR